MVFNGVGSKPSLPFCYRNRIYFFPLYRDSFRGISYFLLEDRFSFFAQ